MALALTVALLAVSPNSCLHNRISLNSLRDNVNHYLDVMHDATYPISTRKYKCPKATSWPHTLWGVRWKRAREKYLSPPNYKAWLCIQDYETGHTRNWQINTGNGYYGGLQMDYDFQQTYGPHLLRDKGTANNWLPLEQIWTAVKAQRERGWWPWPNTAHYCGLL